MNQKKNHLKGFNQTAKKELLTMCPYAWHWERSSLSKT